MFKSEKQKISIKPIEEYQFPKDLKDLSAEELELLSYKIRDVYKRQIYGRKPFK